jgi:uncharacterized membrane protein YczE
MNEVEINSRNTIIYIFGMIFIALGVVLMLRSNLGSSSWDSLHYALSNVLPITIGNATILVAALFTVAIIILNKSFKYLYMFIPIFIVGYLIDAIDLVLLKEFTVTHIVTRTLTFIAGISILPLGGALLIYSTYPAGVFDEFMLVMMRVFKTNKMVTIRVIMELTAVLTAFTIGLLGGFGLGKIYFGTLIFSFTVGMYVKTYLKLFERKNDL